MGMKKREDYELLAPAGSYESLAAAGQAGADAIYFGIEQLNMRARSSANFTASFSAHFTNRNRYGIYYKSILCRRYLLTPFI